MWLFTAEACSSFLGIAYSLAGLRIVRNISFLCSTPSIRRMTDHAELSRPHVRGLDVKLLSDEEQRNKKFWFVFTC